MTYEWTQADLIKFIELYQAEEILWDPKNPNHKDKVKFNDAWKRISEIMNIPIGELKTKNNSVLATFRGHLRKKKASLKSGAGQDEIYKPIWFLYDQLECFLGDINTCTTTIDSEGENSSQVDDEIDERGSNTLAPISPMSQTQKETLRPTVRRRAYSPELKEAERQMKEAFSTLHRIANRKEEEDECDYFAKILSKKLKKLPEGERELFMYEIDGMFIRRWNLLNNVPNSPPVHLPFPTFNFTRSPYANSSRHAQSIPMCQSLSRSTSSLSSYSEPTQTSHIRVLTPDHNNDTLHQLPINILDQRNLLTHSLTKTMAHTLTSETVSELPTLHILDDGTYQNVTREQPISTYRVSNPSLLHILSDGSVTQSHQNTTQFQPTASNRLLTEETSATQRNIIDEALYNSGYKQ